MIPYDIDPSLHSGEPEPDVLDDGFSPPRPQPPAEFPATQASTDAPEAEPSQLNS